jgi:hypothetical protein
VDAFDDFVETRWNPWTRVMPIWIDGESKAVPRAIRLCGPSCRPGDPVQVIDGRSIIEGRIARIESSVLFVMKTAAIGPARNPQNR